MASRAACVETIALELVLSHRYVRSIDHHLAAFPPTSHFDLRCESLRDLPSRLAYLGWKTPSFLVGRSVTPLDLYPSLTYQRRESKQPSLEFKLRGQSFVVTS